MDLLPLSQDEHIDPEHDYSDEGMPLFCYGPQPVASPRFFADEESEIR